MQLKLVIINHTQVIQFIHTDSMIELKYNVLGVIIILCVEERHLQIRTGMV